MKITFMLLDAFEVDGTVRSTFTLAGELARRHDVEIVSVLRNADRPVFPLSDRVRLRCLVDLRPDAKVPWPNTARAERLMAEPTQLVHPEERCYNKFSAWTDVAITRFLKRLRTNVLVTTRAGLNLAAARFAPRRVVVVGQEHLQLGIHAPGILAEIKEWYPRLDALTCLTVADREDYEAALPDGACPVYTIGNGLPDRVYPRSRQENKLVVAAGRMVWIKGYDLLISAFAKVVEKHPEWRLRIYGQGVRRDELLAKGRRLHPRRHLQQRAAHGAHRRHGGRAGEGVRPRHVLARGAVRHDDHRGVRVRAARRRLRLPARPPRDHHRRP